MTLTSANTEGFLWLTHAELDGLQRGYGGRETYSHTESSTVQASRQAGRQGQVTYLDAGSVRPPRTNAPPM